MRRESRCCVRVLFSGWSSSEAGAAQLTRCTVKWCGDCKGARAPEACRRQRRGMQCACGVTRNARVALHEWCRWLNADESFVTMRATALPEAVTVAWIGDERRRCRCQIRLPARLAGQGQERRGDVRPELLHTAAPRAFRAPVKSRAHQHRPLHDLLPSPPVTQICGQVLAVFRWSLCYILVPRSVMVLDTLRYE